ncbi:MAG: rhodanese-like domain-containing protein [Elusimicrobiota bacterium]|nr:rhodanese-like domain-containing protein [Elusimicrobiota bacterium]
MNGLLMKLKHLWLGLLGLAVSAPSAGGFSGVRGDAAAKLAADPTVFLLDVRTPGEHAEARLTRSTLVPVDELAGRLSELPADKDKPILVYCAMGGRSARASQLLIEKGWKTVYNMEGGITGWKAEGRPVER